MTWNEFIEEESKKDYFKSLMDYVKKEYMVSKCHPDFDDIFNAYKLTPIKEKKVVILGQDPYHNDNEAHGLAFSVKNAKNPPSLKNIYKEMKSDLGIDINEVGDLTYLAKQGVFLLNTTLTVRHNEPLSHFGKGWETFTDAVIKKLSDGREILVFMLWGSYAKEKIALIDTHKHLVLTTVHPSPRSADHGFFGCKHFSKANTFLQSKGIQKIDR